MFDLDLRLITVLGVLTALTIISLGLDYYNRGARSFRWGFWMAILCIITGFYLTLHAVLPENQFYGRVFSYTVTSQKVIALTFDDGPYPPYTEQILDILRENDVRATFFIVGQNAENHPEIIRRIVAEGHQLGNHTYNHRDLLTADRHTIEKEITRTNDLIKQITGVTMDMVRTPHGFKDAVVMDVISAYDMKVIGWSVMARDWTNPGVGPIVSRVTDHFKSGAIVLLHDGDGIVNRDSRAQTVDATRHIIRKLKEQGYRFVTVKEITETREDI